MEIWRPVLHSAKYWVNFLFAIIWKTENKLVASDEEAMKQKSLLCLFFHINQLLCNVSETQGKKAITDFLEMS